MLNEVANALPFLIAVVLIVLGHIVNMVMAVASGVIHGLRLNFLEWYHYSFEGGGRPFRPLKLLDVPSANKQMKSASNLNKEFGNGFRHQNHRSAVGDDHPLLRMLYRLLDRRFRLPRCHGTRRGRTRKFIGMSAAPSSQTIYGFILMLLMNRAIEAGTLSPIGGIAMGLLTGMVMVGSSVFQGMVCASGIQASAKQPAIFGKCFAAVGIIESLLCSPSYSHYCCYEEAC